MSFAFVVMVSLPVVGDGAFAGGEVLWWMVQHFEDDEGILSGTTIKDFDGTVIPHNSDGTYTVRDMDVNAARVRVAGTDNYLDIYVNAGGKSVLYGDTVPVPGYFFASVGEYASTENSFMVELGNYDYGSGTWYALAASEAVSYDTLKNSEHWIAQWSTGTWPSPTGGYWVPNAYTVPEPSGGLLLLIGGGLLALRRRRKAWR